MIYPEKIDVEALREYLDEDCQAHLRMHGKWWLDSGKLLAALEHAGRRVEGKAGALTQLDAALKLASETGLLDDLTGSCHPDSINDVCDAVTHAVAELTGRGGDGRDNT